MGAFIAALSSGMDSSDFDPQENVFEGIWAEYKRVILHSLITSFGLDFIVQDQHGGDVDTVHNVRQIGDDPEMQYKNSQNAAAYENRGEYDSAAYHADPRYKEMNREVSAKKKEGKLVDSYTGKKVARNANVDLDHVVAAKEIHDDRGRILANLNGQDLANCRENLEPTDRTINRSMKADSAEDYLAKQEAKEPERQRRIAELKEKESLTDKERKELEKQEKLEEIDSERVREADRKARRAYEAKVERAYYTSGKFYKDTATAAAKRGAEMGARQALGLVFVEIYMGAEQELKNMPANHDLNDMLQAVIDGVKKGAESAKTKYREIFAKFGEGFLAGTLASITTTICNIFFTTTKYLIRNIRQIYASVVQAGKVLLFNPDNFMLGDRIKTATVILATGASVLVGTAAGELMGNSPAGQIPGMAPILQTFTSTLVSGLLSCTLLVFLDRSKFMNVLIHSLNEIPSEVNNYGEIADAFELLAAKMEKIDIEKFRADTGKYQNIAEKISRVDDEEQVNELLLAACKAFDIVIPWKGDFDSFMGNKSNQLVFE